MAQDIAARTAFQPPCEKLACPGLTAAVIVSQWTWTATLLMPSNIGWRVGVSGPFWYASGATIQILLFAILAIQVKRRASHMHTFMEFVKAHFGTVTHIIMICFALTTNEDPEDLVSDPCLQSN